MELRSYDWRSTEAPATGGLGDSLGGPRSMHRIFILSDKTSMATHTTAFNLGAPHFRGPVRLPSSPTLVDGLGWELARVCLLTHHVSVSTSCANNPHLEALYYQHNSPKPKANPVIPVSACHMPRIKHTYRNTICTSPNEPYREIFTWHKVLR